MRSPTFASIATAGALTAAVLLAAAPSRAAADASTAHPTNQGIAWGAVTGELTTAAVFYLNFGTDLVPNHGPGMTINFTPMVIAPAVGWGLRHRDPAPAFAAHGAGWLGLDLFLLGTLIDGRAERHRMKIGPAALTLGALGAIAGGYIGAREVDDQSEAAGFLAGPPVGFAAGGLVLGGMYVLLAGIDGDKAPSQFATGAVAGLTMGLGFAAYSAYRSSPTGASARAARLTPAVDPDPRRFMFSLGGTF